MDSNGGRREFRELRQELVLEFVDLVFELEFFALQFGQPEFVDTGMRSFRLDQSLDGLVATGQFLEVTAQRHPALLFDRDDPGRHLISMTRS